MSALDRRVAPASVAALPGREHEKLLQRFHQLDAANRARLLDTALYMIENQLDALLPPRDRRIKRLICQIERCLDYLAENTGNTIQTRVTRGLLKDYRQELAALGYDYFG